MAAMDEIRIGHWTDEEARTGCTVVLFPEGTVASGEVRGAAPATREFELLDPTRTVRRIDAVVLSGGSAYGLAAADGVMGWCEEQGRGFVVGDGVGIVPIVVGMCLFDLPEGDPRVRPTAASGRAACEAAGAWSEASTGRVGAGTGATVGKTGGREGRSPGGLGIAVRRSGDIAVLAVIAVNAFGHVVREGDVHEAVEVVAPDPFTNTTVGIVVTNARLTKVDCLRLAQSAHDGYARALSPSHTTYDGDAVVAAATGDVAVEPEDLEALRHLASLVTADAIRAGVPTT